MPVTSSPPWNDGLKVSFHRCACGSKFKSIQMKPQAMQEKIDKMEKVAERARNLEKEAARLNRILNYA